MAHTMQHYGWIPDLPDARDHMYAAPPPVLAALPPQVDLRPTCPPVLDQGALGSCTANAMTTANDVYCWGSVAGSGKSAYDAGKSAAVLSFSKTF